MYIEVKEARYNLPKDGPEVFKRVCKEKDLCIYHCEHNEPHIVSIACGIRCCDVPGKNVRCVGV